jgi:PPOX class probable F420-dependent enzyme
LTTLSPEQLEYLRKGRVARLGTFGENGVIQMVPTVYAFFENRIYSVIDGKKKSGSELKRIKNIRKTGKATLLVDNYSENWDELSFLMLQCKAKVIGPGEDQAEKMLARIILKEKYKQYSNGGYFPENIDQAIFVRLEPEKAFFWQNLR